MSVNQTVSTLVFPPTTSCPRCDGRQILGHSVNPDSQFAWYECHECGHLWAIPQGWTPHVEPGARQLPKRGAA
jgi:predicted RNA-binding Zn-ribbon protein involved in translation (DUF1610 family)